MYQRIFVPVDDSETSALALAEACKLAKEVGAAVKMVHVVDLAQFGWGGAEFLDAAELQGSIREAGEQVLGASGIVSLFLLLSGLYLWWPKAGKALSQLRWRQMGRSSFGRAVR